MFRALPPDHHLSSSPLRPCTQKSNGRLGVTLNGDEDGLHDVYDEGLGSKFRETAWKKPSEGALENAYCCCTSDSTVGNADFSCNGLLYCIATLD